MSHRKYDYQGRKYIFYTAKYKEYFELFRNKNNNFRKLDLDRLIAEKCSYDVETVKKWRNSGESGSTPSDMEAVQIIADIFGVSVLELLEPVDRSESMINYNNNLEMEAVRRVLRAFINLLKTYKNEKGKLQYDLLNLAESNYYEAMIPEGVVEECPIYYDGGCFRYPQIDEMGDAVRTELIIAAIDLPESIIEELHRLQMFITVGDECEKEFVHEKDIPELVEEMGPGAVDAVNYGTVQSAATNYFEKLLEILKPYNLNLDKFKILIY